MRVKYGLKKGATYWGLCYESCAHKDLNELIEYTEIDRNSLYDVCNICGLDVDAVVKMAKIINHFWAVQKSDKCLHESDFEAIYHGLTAEIPVSGIYRNEYYDGAMNRIHRARYELYR